MSPKKLDCEILRMLYLVVWGLAGGIFTSVLPARISAEIDDIQLALASIVVILLLASGAVGRLIWLAYGCPDER